MYVSISVCLPGTQEGQKKASDPLRLEIQMVPKTEPQFSRRAISALNPLRHSFSPSSGFLKAHCAPPPCTVPNLYELHLTG